MEELIVICGNYSFPLDMRYVLVYGNVNDLCFRMTE